MSTPDISFPPQADALPSSETRRDEDRLRPLGYVVVAVAALITGLILGQSGGPSPRESRIAWPSFQP